MNGSSPTFTSTDPMTGEVLWEGPVASEIEVDQAIQKAKKALPQWAALSIDEREKFLLTFKEILNQKKEPFATLISKEMGKPLWESRTEVDAMIGKIAASIDAQKERCQDRIRELPRATSITRHKPLGILAILGPFNFPGHLPNGHITPALLAGNTVVFKPSEHTPLVGEELVKIWKESGIPDGVVNNVQGGLNTGKALSQHQEINGLLFTGSWKTGKLLAEQFGKHPDKLLALEMGGNNPLVIGEISNIEAAAYLIIQSAFLTSGQRCTCARRLIVPNTKQGDNLIDTLIALTRKIIIGSPFEEPEPFMGPVVDLHASGSLLNAQGAFTAMGGKPLLQMEELKPETPLLSPAIIDITEMETRLDEEYFGPFLQVIRVDSFEEAIHEANRTQFGLSAGILSDDRQQYERFYRESKAGVINWNTQTTGAISAAPFGGVGRSGNYRPSAYYAADYCNYPVASMENGTLKLSIPSTGFKKEST